MLLPVASYAQFLNGTHAGGLSPTYLDIHPSQCRVSVPNCEVGDELWIRWSSSGPWGDWSSVRYIVVVNGLAQFTYPMLRSPANVVPSSSMFTTRHVCVVAGTQNIVLQCYSFTAAPSTAMPDINAGYHASLVVDHFRWESADRLPPDHASLVEYWHAELGASSASVVGRKLGLTLVGANTPAVAVDQINSNPNIPRHSARLTMQGAASGSKHWRASGLSTGIVAGSRPVLYAIGCTRSLVTVSGGDLTLCGAGGGAGAAEDQIRVVVEGNAGVNRFEAIRRHNSGNIRISSGNIQDTEVHLFKLVAASATVGFALYVDGTLVANQATFGATDPISSDWTYGGIASIASGAGCFSDASIDYMGWHSSDPGADYDARMLAYARNYWGSKRP